MEPSKIFKVYILRFTGYVGWGHLPLSHSVTEESPSLLSLKLCKTIDDCDMQISPFQHTVRKLSVAQLSGNMWLTVICLVVSLWLTNRVTEEWPKENRFFSSPS